MNGKIKPTLSAAARVGYLPISFIDLRKENRQLADLISCQMNNQVSAADCQQYSSMG
ncbi:MAG: hypothetical protein WA364_09740 [Candidatus Nitrosopolaris sp.]